MVVSTAKTIDDERRTIYMDDRLWRAIEREAKTEDRNQTISAFIRRSMTRVVSRKRARKGVF